MQPKKQKLQRIVSAQGESTIVEMVYDHQNKKTHFVEWDGSNYTFTHIHKTSSGTQFAPYSADNPLIARQIVNFPSVPQKYESEQVLFESIRRYIHHYVDLSPRFEMIAAYYVMLTWVYDAFNEVPYLRLRGDYGSGKTRFLLIVGSICYKSFLSSGASSMAPIFHMLNSIGGTLVLDESDFRFSDEKNDMVKILNNGTVRDFPVLRCEKINNFEFRPKAYDVFTPKILATRGYFNDNALESRFISEEMGQRKIRGSIPTALPDKYKGEALVLRNQLLMYRFKLLNSIVDQMPDANNDMSGRLNQMFLPLLSVVSNKEHRKAILDLALEYEQQHRVDISDSAPAQVCTIIAEYIDKHPGERLAIKNILYVFIERHVTDYERRITAKWIGFIVRKKLHFKTKKSGGEYIVILDEQKLVHWCDVFDINLNVKS